MTLRLVLLPALAAIAFGAVAAEDYSPAEKALFMRHQLASIKPPATLNYRFARSGSLEPAFDDRVAIRLRAQADGACCATTAEFLSGPRRLALPDIESAQGNPAILYFLERDIREMNRLTKGQANYFRKRIRMAVYQSATMRTLSVPWQGREVEAQEITIAPYLDDPLRARFEKLAGKRYVFTLSDAVPGGVYAIRTQVDAADAAAAPLIVEEMRLDDAAPR